MIVSELAKKIGLRALIRQDGLGVHVEIVDAKTAYGNTRYRITAIDGDGSTIWVDASRVRILDEIKMADGDTVYA